MAAARADIARPKNLSFIFIALIFKSRPLVFSKPLIEFLLRIP